MINDTTKSTNLMRGENLMLWLIVERFVKVGKKISIFFLFYFLNNIFKFVLFLFNFICI